MTVQEWLGSDNQIGIDIWEKKYRHDNESFDKWLDRVSGGDEDLRDLIAEKKFLFGGRTLANRGTGKKGSFSNCYSRGFIDDSLEDIMQANTDIAHTFKAQGGQGLSLSKLRPKGCGINSGQFESDGIIPFMEMYNRTTESISQGGSRKGALIMTLDIWHKEAKEFITIKSEESKIQKANLSLEIDDEFMEAVKSYYETGNTITKLVKRTFNGNTVEYEVTPIKLYKLMMEKAYDWAEPGCLFTNRFRNYNLMEFHDEYKIETCNPCVSGDTLILTDKGYVDIESVVDTEINIWNGFKYSKVVPEITGRNQEMVKVSFSDGSEINCTPYHKFILSDDRRAEAKDLNIGDKLTKCFFPVIHGGKTIEEKIAYTQGFFMGDGYIQKREWTDRLAIDLHKEKRKCVDKLKYRLKNYCPSFDGETVTLEYLPEIYTKDFVPSVDYDIKSRLNWLAGYIDSDGTLQSSDGALSISSINRNVLLKVKYLLNTLGCNGRIALMKEECDKELPKNDGSDNKQVYHCQDCYRILINSSNVRKLIDLGLNLHRVSMCSSPNRDASRFITIEKVESIPNCEVVYCFNEPINHSGIFNGVITAQCGEQALAKNSACNLGSINLSEFVEKPFTKEAYFNISEFEKAIDRSVRALDQILDENMENHALEEQRQMTNDYRNIGLGIMGMWDVLVKLGYSYGTVQSIRFLDVIMSKMFRQALCTSSEIARDKGVFPKYNKNVLNSKIIKNHFTDEELRENGMLENGLRNCSLLSVAPTGSLGSMLNISTGCEPAFSISYNRKTESLNGGQDKYYKVFVDAAQKYLEQYPDKELPETFVTSGEIYWRDRIDMQSVLQNHIDTAISSTVNLPNECTQEEVEKLYLYAWEKGLKGVTIYRDGCKRSGILSTSDGEGNNDTDENPNELPRGYIIKADDNCIGRKRTLMTGCGTLHCEAFFDPATGDLLETYFSKGSSGGCNNFMISLSRLISLSARAGVDIYSIVDQLQSSGTCPSYAVRSAIKRDTSKGSCCPVAIGNALLQMYEEMQKEINEDEFMDELQESADKRKIPNNPCPTCGEELVYEGGCNTCKACGYSKCD